MARVVTIPIGPIFTSGPCRGIIHVIEKGDTLYKLGQRYHVSVSRIMYANPYVNIYNLQIGDELCIPVGQEPRAGERMGQTEFDNLPGQQDMAPRTALSQDMAPGTTLSQDMEGNPNMYGETVNDWERSESQMIPEDMEQPEREHRPGNGEMTANRTRVMEEETLKREPEESQSMSDPWSASAEARTPKDAPAENQTRPDFMTHPPLEGMFETGYRTESRGRSKEQCKSHYPVS